MTASRWVNQQFLKNLLAFNDYTREAALATSFATSILPLFRPSDIQCMAARGVKLDDAAWMRDPAGRLGFPDHANARRVYSKLSSGDMPPDGAWPQDQLDVFAQWMSEGFNA